MAVKYSLVKCKSAFFSFKLHRDYLIIWVVSSASIFWDNRDHPDDYGLTGPYKDFSSI